MIGIILTCMGGFVGWYKARKRGGNRADKLQYAAIYAMIFAVIGLFVGIIADRFVFGG